MAFLRDESDLSIRYELTPPSASIGRAENNNIVLADDMRISRHQARLDLTDGQWVLFDSRSSNGTWVNGQQITTHSLREGDRIRVGGTTLVFTPVADPWATVTEDGDNTDQDVPTLSEREREVLALVGAGQTDKEIAESLFISVATVRSHLDRIRDKTGCRRRPELTRLALSLDLH